MDPQPRGPDWMQITPKAGSLFHANSHFGAEGLEPRFAQRLVSLFFWPMRASSANHISMARASTPFSRAISSRRAGNVF